MADQQLALVRYQGNNAEELNNAQELNNAEEPNTEEAKKDDDIDHLAQVIASKVLQALGKVNDNYTQERCKEGSDQLEGQVKALEAFGKLGDERMQVSLADLEVINQPGDKLMRGRAGERREAREALVELCTDFSKATSKRIQQAHEERAVVLQQFNLRPYFFSGAALFLVASKFKIRQSHLLLY